MNEEVIKDLYNKAKDKGYTKSMDAFTTLLQSNEDVQNDMFSYVQGKGYKKDINSFHELIGVKKKETGASAGPMVEDATISEDAKVETIPPGDSSVSDKGDSSKVKHGIAKVESLYKGSPFKDNPYAATNPNSSAAGKYQILWDEHNKKITQVTGVKTKEEFLKNPEAQEKFMDWWVPNVLEPDSLKLKKALPEQTKNLSDDDLLALVHFQGLKRAKKFLEEGSMAVADDQNITVDEYLEKFRKGTLDYAPEAQKESPEQEQRSLEYEKFRGSKPVTAEQMEGIVKEAKQDMGWVDPLELPNTFFDMIPDEDTWSKTQVALTQAYADLKDSISEEDDKTKGTLMGRALEFVEDFLPKTDKEIAAKTTYDRLKSEGKDPKTMSPEVFAQEVFNTLRQEAITRREEYNQEEYLSALEDDDEGDIKKDSLVEQNLKESKNLSIAIKRDLVERASIEAAYKENLSVGKGLEKQMEAADGEDRLLIAEQYAQVMAQAKRDYDAAVKITKKINENTKDLQSFETEADLLKRNYDHLINKGAQLGSSILKIGLTGAKAIKDVGVAIPIVGLFGDVPVAMARYGVEQIEAGFGIDMDMALKAISKVEAGSQKLEDKLDAADKWVNENMVDNMRKARQLDDLSSWSDYGQWAGDVLATNISQVAIVALTGPAGLGILSASAYGGKLQGMEEELKQMGISHTKMLEQLEGMEEGPARQALEEKIKENQVDIEGHNFVQMRVASALVAAGEFASERVTLGIIKRAMPSTRFVRVMQKYKEGNIGEQIRLGAKAAYKENGKKLGRWMLAPAEEGGSEVFAQVVENLADKYVMNKDVGIFDHINEAFWSGALIGGTINTTGLVAGAIAQNTLRQDKKTIANNLLTIEKYAKQIEAINNSSAVMDKKSQTAPLYEAALNLEIENGLLISKGIGIAKRLTLSEMQQIGKIDSEFGQLVKKYNDVKNSTVLDDGVKKALIKQYQAQYNQLVTQKDNLLTKGESQDPRYILNEQEVSKEELQAYIADEANLQKLAEGKASVRIANDTSLENEFVKKIKPIQDAIQKPSTEEMDVRQRARDGEEVGVRDTKEPDVTEEVVVEVQEQDVQQKEKVDKTEEYLSREGGFQNVSARVAKKEKINEKEVDSAIDEAYNLLDEIEKDTDISKEDKAALTEIIEEEITKLENYELITETQTRKIAEAKTVRVPKKAKGKTAEEKQFEGKKADYSDKQGGGGRGTIVLVERPDGKEYYVLEGAKRNVLGARPTVSFVLGEKGKVFQNATINYNENNEPVSITTQEKGGKQVTIKDPEIAKQVFIEQTKDEDFDQEFFEETYIEFVGEEDVEVLKTEPRKAKKAEPVAKAEPKKAEPKKAEPAKPVAKAEPKKVTEEIKQKFKEEINSPKLRSTKGAIEDMVRFLRDELGLDVNMGGKGKAVYDGANFNFIIDGVEFSVQGTGNILGGGFTSLDITLDEILEAKEKAQGPVQFRKKPQFKTLNIPKRGVKDEKGTIERLSERYPDAEAFGNALIPFLEQEFDKTINSKILEQGLNKLQEKGAPPQMIKQVKSMLQKKQQQQEGKEIERIETAETNQAEADLIEKIDNRKVELQEEHKKEVVSQVQADNIKPRTKILGIGKATGAKAKALPEMTYTFSINQATEGIRSLEGRRGVSVSGEGANKTISIKGKDLVRYGLAQPISKAERLKAHGIIDNVSQYFGKQAYNEMSPERKKFLGMFRKGKAEEVEAEVVDEVAVIAEEMNKMEGLVIEDVPFEALKGKGKMDTKTFKRKGVAKKPKIVGIADFANMPVMVTISDELTTGEVTNPQTGEVIDNLRGGILGPYTEGMEDVAWSYTGISPTQETWNTALKVYEKNKALFDKLWKEGKLPDQHIPVAVVKMGKDAMKSNEAMVRQVVQNLATFPAKNKAAAYKALMPDIKKLRKTIDNRIKKREEAGKEGKRADKNLLKDYNNIIDFLEKHKTLDAVLENLTDLKIRERPLLINRFTTGKMSLVPAKDSALRAQSAAAKALVKGLPQSEIKKIHLGHLAQTLADPALKNIPDRHIVAMVGIDISSEGPVRTDVHPNYPWVLKGQGLGIMGETVHLAQAMPAAYANIIDKLLKAQAQGKEVALGNIIRDALPSALNNDILKGRPLTTREDDAVRVIAALQLSFPDSQFFTDQATWEEIMASDNVQKRISEGDVVYGFTVDGDVYLNPEFMDFNTPIHEAGHLWVDFIEQNNQKLFQKGIELVEGTKELKEAIAEYGDNIFARKEALAILIGNKGETIVNASQQSKFENWLMAVMKYIQQKFPSLRKLTPQQVSELTLQEFVGGAIKEVLGGKPISPTKVVSKKGEVQARKSPQAEKEALLKEIKSRRNVLNARYIKDPKGKDKVKKSKITKAIAEEIDAINEKYRGKWSDLGVVELEAIRDKLIELERKGKEARREETKKIEEKRKSLRAEASTIIGKDKKGIGSTIVIESARSIEQEPARELYRQSTKGSTFIVDGVSRTKSQFKEDLKKGLPQGTVVQYVPGALNVDAVEAQKKFRLRFFRHDVKDLFTLIHDLFGKGYKGMNFFRKNFIKPMLTAEKIYRSLSDNFNTEFLAMKYKALYPEGKSLLSRFKNRINMSAKTGIKVTTDFGTKVDITNDEAVLLYNYIKNPKLIDKMREGGIKEGAITFEIMKKIVDYVNANPKLKNYADGIVKVYEKYKKPVETALDKEGYTTFGYPAYTTYDEYVEKKTKDYMKKGRSESDALDMAIKDADETFSLLIDIYGSIDNIPRLIPYTPTKVDSFADDMSVDTLIDPKADINAITVMTGNLVARKAGGALKWRDISPQELALNYSRGALRAAAYLKFFKDSNAIFNKTNMDKIEALKGKGFVKELKQAIARVITGQRRAGMGEMSGAVKFLYDYVNMSQGLIMFLNKKSALLQQLSILNFALHTNPVDYVAGTASLATKKEMAKTLQEIWNSKYMVGRRKGAAGDISMAEVMDMKGSWFKNIIKVPLEKGYSFTQWGDSIAIAIGGLPYYAARKRVYEKEGLSEAEAKEKAMLDFEEVSEGTQQSAIMARISSQQVTALGRTILTFANIPMQYNRLMYQSFLDIKDGRGNLATNISKIVYYGAVQNFLFSALQQGLFSLFWDDDDEEQEIGKTTRTINSMANTLLRGTGMFGAIVAGVKDAAMNYAMKEKPDFWEDMVMSIASIAPSVGYKLQQWYVAYKEIKFAKEEDWDQFSNLEIDEEFLDNPYVRGISKSISTGLNSPIERIFQHIDDVRDAANEEYDGLLRILRAAGWSRYALGMDAKWEEEKEVEGYMRKSFRAVPPPPPPPPPPRRAAPRRAAPRR